MKQDRKKLESFKVSTLNSSKSLCTCLKKSPIVLYYLQVSALYLKKYIGCCKHWGKLYIKRSKVSKDSTSYAIYSLLVIPH